MQDGARLASSAYLAVREPSNLTFLSSVRTICLAHTRPSMQGNGHRADTLRPTFSVGKPEISKRLLTFGEAVASTCTTRAGIAVRL